MSMQAHIEAQLAELAPLYLAVENESHQHSKGTDSHFKITLVSEVFAGLLPVKRHQKVYALLAQALNSGVHALALHLYTPEEWQARQQERPDSPGCYGGGH
ncbi:BolA protein [Allopseudospirillum japonicum]|uniref:BolA protein n=1 Tax=Allopseudospirillum japonicum TaxID=64971 RepID=A0A1H6TIM2_9GAMM|nr:BolA/IbaG family iron-sulfur metabolism protein [Allopseudospirillum japonicum]SEI79156.1 BolA protein [Allopseudospirillum japonicum]